MKALKNLPILLVLLCAGPSTASAQDIGDFEKEFEAFQNEANSKYESFRDECNAKYAKFLAESWKSFKSLAPIQQPKEQQNLPESVLRQMQNPALADTVASVTTNAGINFRGIIVDIKKFFRRRKVEPMVQPRNVAKENTPADVVPQEKKQKEDLSEIEALLNKKAEEQKIDTRPLKTNNKPTTVAQQPSKRTISFMFYGTPMEVEVSDLVSRLKFKGLEPQKVADAWTLCSERKYVGMIQDCLGLKEQYKLCDWAYLQLLKTLSDKLFGENTNESTFLTAYIYSQSGYRIRLGQSDGNLLMLYGSEHSIYNQPRFKIDDLCYYVLGNLKSNSLYWIQACDKAINDREQSLSLLIPEQPTLNAVESNKRIVESDKYPEMRMEVSVNENLIDFFNSYPPSCLNNDPLTRWAMYANTPLAEDVKAQIYPGLQKALEGLSEEEQVSRLLSLIQPRGYNKPETSLIYGADNDMWGHDRAFFAEETLFYPYSDCEDHAILFSRLVRDLLHLPVVLVYYSSPASPPHLATGVKFSEPLKGDNQDRLVMQSGDTFYICDPTNYVPKPGVTMREMKNNRAQVILLN